MINASITNITRILTAMVSQERTTYEMILTQEDLSPLFERDFVQVRVTCTTGNAFGKDDESTTIRVCSKCNFTYTKFRKFYVFGIKFYIVPSECQDGFTNNCSHNCTRTNLTEHECSCNPGFELSMDICSGMYLYIRSFTMSFLVSITVMELYLS